MRQLSDRLTRHLSGRLTRQPVDGFARRSTSGFTRQPADGLARRSTSRLTRQPVDPRPTSASPLAATAPAAHRLARPDGGRAHIAALDGLRGFAVAAVLLFHAGWLSGGFLGVDLFFVLSGFLITGLLLAGAGSGGPARLAGFWVRRARRLLPALAVMVLVTVSAVWTLGTVAQLRFALDDLPWVAAQAVNWHYITGRIGYWNASGTHVFAHLWSIGVEWQFYLLWPPVVLVAALTRHAQRTVAVVAGAGVMASLALMVMLGTAVDTTRAYEGTDTRAAALLLGALAATAPVRSLAARLPRRAANVLGVVLAGAIAVAWTVTDGEKAPLLFKGGLGRTLRSGPGD